jgi:cation diffusion facilitator family transporter
MASSTTKVVYAALLGNVAIAATKFGAAWLTGSSAMLSEAVHSLVDTLNELLLLYGMHRAARPPDRTHPLGHGRELYFWSFIVALLVFALGAGVSLYEGVLHIVAPRPIEDAFVGYAVLGVSFAFEALSWSVAFREFRREKGERGWIEAVRRSKDPTSFTVLFEDTAALAGLAIALAGMAASQFLDLPVLDGVASVAIGVVLALTAALLARESKGLLIGEAADPDLVRSIVRIATDQRGIVSATPLMTVHLAPRQVVVALGVDFDDAISAQHAEQACGRIEERVRRTHPEVVALFIKPQGPAPRRLDAFSA